MTATQSDERSRTAQVETQSEAGDQDTGVILEEIGEEAIAGETAEEKKLPEDLISLVEQKDEEILQLKDRLLRIAAEMENTRKRLERERSESICYANEQILRELLPIVDNLERALEHGEKEANAKSLLEGVALTLKNFQDTLARFGCTSFEAIGKPFDPNYHEAVMRQESGEYPENTVLQQLQKGYVLRERLLRPAMVVVSKLPAESS